VCIVIGLGIDAVDIARFRSAMLRSPRLAERVFTASERAVASSRADASAVLAARFAVREATMKALGVGLGAFSWQWTSKNPVRECRNWLLGNSSPQRIHP
jgi:holo-[acyl-carrier protein] synthase